MAAPEIRNVLTGKKKLKSVATDVRKKTLCKHLCAGETRKCHNSRGSPPEIGQRRRTWKDIFANLKRILDKRTTLFFDVDTSQTLAWRFLTNFLFWNQLNLLMFKKFIKVLHWM